MYFQDSILSKSKKKGQVGSDVDKEETKCIMKSQKWKDPESEPDEEPKKHAE